MDPDANLREQRELVGRITSGHPRSGDAERLAALVEDLDDHLRCSRPFPLDWAATGHALITDAERRAVLAASETFHGMAVDMRRAGCEQLAADNADRARALKDLVGRAIVAGVLDRPVEPAHPDQQADADLERDR
jgi:hypothetical protein